MNGNSTGMKVADSAPSEGLCGADDDGNEWLAAASIIDLVEQWDRITEKGTVLSRYTCSEEQLNFAICESRGDKRTNHLQRPRKLIVLDDDWQIFDSQEIHLSYSTKDRAKVLVDKLAKERPGNPHETRSFSRIVYISMPEENLTWWL